VRDREDDLGGVGRGDPDVRRSGPPAPEQSAVREVGPIATTLNLQVQVGKETKASAAGSR
jgi:hypothetical protein